MNRNEKLLANEITNYWANFIKYDTPNDPNKEQKWPEYKHRSLKESESTRNSESGAKYMVFKSTGNRVSSGYSLETCILWNSYLPRMLKIHGNLKKKHFRLEYVFYNLFSNFKIKNRLYKKE